MSTPSDPLARLRAIIEAWPETREKLSHGAPTWWGGHKTFATFHDNHHGDGRVAVWVKSSFDEQELLVETDPETFFVPPYVGRDSPRQILSEPGKALELWGFEGDPNQEVGIEERPHGLRSETASRGTRSCSGPGQSQPQRAASSASGT